MPKIALLALALSMVAVTSAAARPDPYKSNRAVVSMDGRQVATADHVALPKASGDVANYRAGGNPGPAHKSPGRTKYEPITLERGVTQDAEFANWAAQSGAARRSLTLTQPGPGGSARRYSLSGCQVAHPRVLPKLGGRGGAVAIENLELSCENVTMVPPR